MYSTAYKFLSVPPLMFDPSQDKTIQSDKDSTDINLIVDRMLKSGSPLPTPLPPTHADFSEVGDFREAMDLIVESNRAFNALDADIRDRFRNDPARFVDFVSDPQNADELVKMGLAERKPVKVESPPTRVVIVGDSNGNDKDDGKASGGSAAAAAGSGK